MEMLYKELEIMHRRIGNGVWESRMVYAELGMVCGKSGIVYGNRDAWELEWCEWNWEWCIWQIGNHFWYRDE
jgi:hypothetical protein